MYRLFTKTHTQNRGTTNPSSHRTTLMRINRNLDVVTDYMRKKKHVVDNEHLLVKLIKSLNASPLDDTFDYYRKVRGRYIDVARVHGISSSVVRGQDTTQVFFGGGVDEILYTVSEKVDLITLDKEWESLVPVKVIRHPSTSFSMEPLDGTGFRQTEGLAVIQIDIVKLALQFKYWYMKQKESGVEYMESIRHYVWQYAIANAFPSYLDMAVLNRMDVLFDGGRGEPYRRVWPVTVIDVSRDIDTYLLDRVVMVSRTPMLFDNILENILGVSETSMLEACRLPVVSHTRPITWVFVAARANVLGLLLRINKEAGGARNTQELNTIRRILRETRNDRSLPDFVRDEIAEKITPYV